MSVKTCIDYASLRSGISHWFVIDLNGGHVLQIVLLFRVDNILQFERANGAFGAADVHLNVTPLVAHKIAI